MKIDFSGKNVLVTGATRGIGKAIAYHFEIAGANLIITGTHKKTAEIDKIIHRAGKKRIKYICVDFLDKTSLNSFLGKLEKEDRIDVCINNAGINRINTIDDTQVEDFDAITRVNYRAPYLINQVVGNKMKSAKYGRIINIASIWSTITKPGRSAYTASKFGLVGMTKTFAIELAPYNILVNSVSPGFFKTELTDSTMTPATQKQLKKLIPIQRLGKPDEIAKLVLFLASDLNTYITAQNIIIDGGFTNV